LAWGDSNLGTELPDVDSLYRWWNACSMTLTKPKVRWEGVVPLGKSVSSHSRFELLGWPHGASTHDPDGGMAVSYHNRHLQQQETDVLDGCLNRLRVNSTSPDTPYIGSGHRHWRRSAMDGDFCTLSVCAAFDGNYTEIQRFADELVVGSHFNGSFALSTFDDLDYGSD
jgi:hypothetical protein